MYQLSFEDIELYKKLALQPYRVAFIDECGNFGFDFQNNTTSKPSGSSLYYVICAVVIKSEDIPALEAEAEKIRINNFQQGEMKSSLIGDNHKRRFKILYELSKLNFSLVILIADKQKFYREHHPLANYKESFIKYLHQKLYDTMYTVYPKLKIIVDEYGSSEFQKSFRNYLETHRPKPNFLNEYDFDYVNSIQSPLVQIADLIAGSIMQHLLDENAPDVLRFFKDRIREIVNFPNIYPPFTAGMGADNAFDKNIYALAEHRASQYIDFNKNIEEKDIRMRVLFLKNLLWYVRNISADKYISSGKIIRVLSDLTNSKVRRDYLYRKIIAPLRDAGVIIASCPHGYKIPTCVEDIYSYVNQTIGVVGPMLSRIEKCRQLIIAHTDGTLDILEDPALKKYKHYFGD